MAELWWFLQFFLLAPVFLNQRSKWVRVELCQSGNIDWEELLAICQGHMSCLELLVFLNAAAVCSMITTQLAINFQITSWKFVIKVASIFVFTARLSEDGKHFYIQRFEDGRKVYTSTNLWLKPPGCLIKLFSLK